jgi:hypothetical protein
VLTNASQEQLGLTLYAASLAAVPIAIAIAILRHGLYDIDRLISRTLSYGVVTALLATLFVVSIFGLTAAFGTLANGNSLAVALSTLLVAVLFGPIRGRAQGAIDRRFDRARYDATRTMGSLTARLRDDVTVERVEADVVGAVDRTFRPRTAGLWLRPRGARRADSVTIPGRAADTVLPT